LLLALVVVAFGGQANPVVATHTMAPTGLVCTTNPTATFTLTTQTGYITLPDGNQVFMWGFSESEQPFQHPSPSLCVTEGDNVTIVLHNTLDQDVSIIFPGIDDVYANGLPAQPQFDAAGAMSSLTNVAPAGGGLVTYTFTASRPGTFLYESGTETTKQVNMGLYGALVVRPLGHPDWAYNDPTTQFNPLTEYLMLISDIDPDLHASVEHGQPYNMNNFTPRYFLYNGRAFPDTIYPNGVPFLPNQPYSSLAIIKPHDGRVTIPDPLNPLQQIPNPGYFPYPALMRYLNVMAIDTAHHPHGNHARIIAQDATPLTGAGGEDLTFEKFLIAVGPGQTVDATWDWNNIDQWRPANPNTGDPGNPIPVTIPQLQNMTFGPFYSGSPYLGNLDTLPVGTQALNQCGEYYHIAHSHAIHLINAWGMVMGGQITFTRIDPPEGCPQ
jgi:hypothetical protein